MQGEGAAAAIDRADPIGRVEYGAPGALVDDPGLAKRPRKFAEFVESRPESPQQYSTVGLKKFDDGRLIQREDTALGLWLYERIGTAGFG